MIDSETYGDSTATDFFLNLNILYQQNQVTLTVMGMNRIISLGYSGNFFCVFGILNRQRYSTGKDTSDFIINTTLTGCEMRFANDSFKRTFLPSIRPFVLGYIAISILANSSRLMLVI